MIAIGRNIVGVFAAAFWILAISPSSSVGAPDTDPSVHQIYEAAEAGHFDQAQQMMDQVLRDHPKSAKAHYVQAELYAKQGKTALARDELRHAEELDPGLSHIDPRSVQKLKAQLGTLHPAEGSTQSPVRSPTTRIPLANRGGTLVAPVIINNAIKLDFTVDSGAADVSIPSDVFSTLVRTATLSKADITGSRKYVNADGESYESRTFIIRSLKVGNVEVANVEAKVSPASAPLLLGQSFLKRFKNWSIDNTTHELILER
jgi:clan AA aspartic protease (TIGR02281 family)